MEKKHQMNTLVFILFMFLFAGLSFTYGSDATIEEEIQYVPGVLILKFTEQYSGSNQVIPDNQSGVVITGITSVDTVCQQYNIMSMERVFPSLKYSTPDLSRYFLAHFDEAQNLDIVQAAFEQCVEIELVEKDAISERFNAEPNDERYNSQWYLYNSLNEIDIDIEEAWNIQTGSSDVVVAVVDSGVYYNHGDLKLNIWENLVEKYGQENVDDDGNGYVDDIRGYSFLEKTNDPIDDYGHGTHIAGIIAARANNATGVAGIAGGWDQTPGCKLMCLKTSMRVDSLQVTSVSAVAKAIHYAVDNGAHIINLSMGFKKFEILKEALDYTSNSDVLVTVAAGNYNANVCELADKDYFPSREDVIAVAATDKYDKRMTDSGNDSNFGPCIDVSAPGKDIFSTWINNGFKTQTGTSMAAPVVAGIAALLKSEKPDWTREMIRIAITETTDPIDDLNPDFEGLLGSGRVNAYSALKQTWLPAVPTNLIATPINQTTIRLTWQDQADNELRYKVTRSTDNITFTKIAQYDEKDINYHFDTNCSPNIRYYYKVKAVNLSGPAIAGPVSAITIVNPPPAAPTNLTATETQPKVIELHWDDVVNETGYEIYKKELDSEWAFYENRDMDDPMSIDNTLSGGTLYSYKVRSYNNYGYSGWSNIASIQTELESPSGLISTANCYEIKLEWQDNSSKEDGFKIERYTGSEYVVIDTVATDTTSYWDVDIPCGQTFSYRVKAFSSLGDSAYSNGEATKTTSCSYCPYGLTMKMKPDKKEINAGESVVYSYEIMNKSDDIIYNCQIIDQTYGEIAKDFSLESGEKKSFFKTAFVKETQTNFAYAEGKDSETEDSQIIKAHSCSTVKVKKN